MQLENKKAIIPSTWLEKDLKTCKWPPKDINLENAVKKYAVPCSKYETEAVKEILGTVGIKKVFNYTFNHFLKLKFSNYLMK